MSKMEIIMHDHEFFLDRIWTEPEDSVCDKGRIIRKNISVHKTYDDALEAKRQHADKGEKIPCAPSLLQACKAALTHVQLLGSGQPSPFRNAEMCTLLGDAIDATEGGRE